MALVTLAMHGALYLVYKTEHDLFCRSHRLANALLVPVAMGALFCIPATAVARPHSLQNYIAHPGAFLAPIVVVISLALMSHYIRKGHALSAFLTSCTFLTAMLCGAGCRPLSPSAAFDLRRR